MKKIGYGVYICAITLIFLYILFPSGALTAYLAYQLSGGRPDLTVTVDQIKPVLPPGLKLAPVNYTRNGQPLFELGQLLVRPELVSLIKKGTVYKFDARAYEGRIVGEVGPFEDGTGKVMGLEARLSTLRIENIPALASLVPRKLTGRLDGHVFMNEEGFLNADLTLAKARVQIDQPLFGLDGINFETVNADLAFDGRQISVRQCILKGAEMDGVIEGSIRLNAGGSQAALNLRGHVRPHHTLLAKLKNNVAARMLKGKDQIKFRIAGPISSPAVSFE